MRFTVRRPASAEVSPCCHRPSGGDVACGVDVGIARPRPAGDALENGLTLAVFRRDVPAVRASLRRIRCGNGFNPPAGLALQPGHQHSPPLTADLPVEAPFLRNVGPRTIRTAARRAGQRAHLQVLDTDVLEAARHIGGGLFDPVAAAICFAGAQAGDGQLGSCAPVRSSVRPGQALLQCAESLGFAGTKAKSVQQFPAGQGNRDRYAAINTHHAAITGSRDGVRHHSKSNVPAPTAIQRDSVGLHGVGDGTSPPELHPPDLGYPYLPIAAAQPCDVTRFESDLPKSLVLARLAPRRATVGAVKKVAHRLGEVPQSLLLHRLRSGCQPVVFGPCRGQLSTLLVVSGRFSAWLPVLLLLYGKIPHKPGMTTVFGQYRRLLHAGKQPKPAHINNLGSTTDNPSKGGKRRFLPWLKLGVSTPQNR